MANRINNGFNFDVRIEHKKEPSSDEEIKEETTEKIIIKDMSSKLEFMSDSVEPILHLEEKSNND